MNISKIQNPSQDQYNQTVDLLNKVFSSFKGSSVQDKKYTAEDINNRMAKEQDVTLWQAAEGENLLGFAITYERTVGFYHIWQLGVDEKARGQGIASSLYNEIEEYAKEKKYKGITVNTFNRFKSNIRLLVKRNYEIYDLEKDGEYAHDPKIKFRLVYNEI